VDPVTDGLEAADIGALTEAGTEEATSAASEAVPAAGDAEASAADETPIYRGLEPNHNAFADA
jgi:hypothetical protein